MSRAVVVATGVSSDGRPEILDLDVGDTEDEVFWTQFPRRLRARGLTGVKLVISDAHTGLKSSDQKDGLGGGMATLSSPFHAQPLVEGAETTRRNGGAATIRTIFAQPDPDAVRTQLRIVADSFQQRYPAMSDLLLEAETDVTAYATFPQSHWKKIWSTNPLERLMREIKRRADVVGIFPDDNSILRLVGAILSKQHDEWQVSDRRYLDEESMALINITDHNQPDKEVNQLPAAGHPPSIPHIRERTNHNRP